MKTEIDPYAIIDRLDLPYEVKIKFKDESILMKLLNIVLFFVPNFMTRYTTVIGNTIYYPNRKYITKGGFAAARTLYHELVHIHDRYLFNKKYFKGAFTFMYMFPQSMAVFSIFSILAVFQVWFALFLVFLVFLAPWPAKWRTDWEARGYAMSALSNDYYIRNIMNATAGTGMENYAQAEMDRIIDNAVRNITVVYYKACWSKRKCRRLIALYIATLLGENEFFGGIFGTKQE